MSFESSSQGSFYNRNLPILNRQHSSVDGVFFPPSSGRQNLDGRCVETFKFFYQIAGRSLVVVNTDGNIGLAIFDESTNAEGVVKRKVGHCNNFLFNSANELNQFLTEILNKQKEIQCGESFYEPLPKSKHYYLVLDRYKEGPLKLGVRWKLVNKNNTGEVAFPRGFSLPRGDWDLAFEGLRAAACHSLKDKYKNLQRPDIVAESLLEEISKKGEEYCLAKTDDFGFNAVVGEICEDGPFLKKRVCDLLGQRSEEAEDYAFKIAGWYHLLCLISKIDRVRKLMAHPLSEAANADSKEFAEKNA